MKLKCFSCLLLLACLSCKDSSDNSTKVNSEHVPMEKKQEQKIDKEGEVNERVKLVIPDTSKQPFTDWWDARCQQPAYLTTDYLFHEKLTNKRKVLSPKTGVLKFLRDKDKSFLMLKQFESKDKKTIYDVKVITSNRYIEYIPAKNGEEAQRKEQELEGDSNKETRRFLSTALVYARSYNELIKDYEIRMKSPPTDNGDWSFYMVPRNLKVSQDLESVEIEMNRANFKSINFKESSRAWIKFEFTGKQDFKKMVTEKEIIDSVK